MTEREEQPEAAGAGERAPDVSRAQVDLDIPPGAIRWGLKFFIVASLIGFGALFFITQDVGASLSAFRLFDLRWGLICLVFASFDWFGGGFRLWLLLRPLKIRLSYWTCVEISGATAALAYLTPAGAGGGPAQLFGLVRSGMSVGRAAAANFASVLVNLIFLSLAGLGAWWLGAASEVEGVQLPLDISAAKLFEWSAAGFGLIAALIILFAVNPRPARKLALRVFGRGRRVRTLLRWLQELHGSLIIYVRKGKLALFLAVLAGTLHFGGRFLLGWAVLRGFGIDAGFWNIVLLHVMIQFLMYFMPTPGGSGVAEIITPAVMSPFMPSSLLVAYTVVWRFFLTYLTVAVGGGILFRWINPRRQEVQAGHADRAGGAAGATGTRSRDRQAGPTRKATGS
jgi:uncharacterized protein (TIRG00374 family)